MVKYNNGTKNCKKNLLPAKFSFENFIVKKHPELSILAGVYIISLFYIYIKRFQFLFAKILHFFSDKIIEKKLWCIYIIITLPVGQTYFFYYNHYNFR